MKKYLLASAAVALFATSPAHAEMTVMLGGYVDIHAGFFDSDIASEDNDMDFVNETEIHINADGKTDSGLEYGVQIQLELATTTNGDGRRLRTDEASLYVGGTWGRVVLGDDDGAIANMAVYAPTVGIGQLDGVGFKFNSGFFDNVNGYAFFPDVTFDSTKVSYFSPEFSGFTFGVSFTPSNDSAAEGDAVKLSETPNAENILEGMVAYSGEFSGVSVSASAGVMRALDDGNAPSPNNFEETIWTAGAQLGYAGFTLGGSYVDFNKFAGSGYLFDGVWEYSWNVGLRYETGPFGIAVQYAAIEGTNDAEETGWGVGVSYTVAPGLSVGADYLYYDVDAGTSPTSPLTTDEGSMFIVSTRVAF